MVCRAEVTEKEEAAVKAAERELQKKEAEEETLVRTHRCPPHSRAAAPLI